MMTGRMIEAKEAEAMGIVNRVVAADASRRKRIN